VYQVSKRVYTLVTDHIPLRSTSLKALGTAKTYLQLLWNFFQAGGKDVQWSTEFMLGGNQVMLRSIRLCMCLCVFVLGNELTFLTRSLDVPILFYPDHDFLSLDGHSGKESWLEMPLRSDRPMPFRCAVRHFLIADISIVRLLFFSSLLWLLEILNIADADLVAQVTLPTSVTFSRSSSIPYFVVFTTTPKSPAFAREIATDATISVSVHRQVTITEQQCYLPPSPPLTPSSDDSDASRKGRLLKRVKSSTPALKIPMHTPSRLGFNEELPNSDPRNKPLPRVPAHTSFYDSVMLHNSMCIGFPKRPRASSDPHRKHPSLEEHTSLPDGLHRSKISLDKNMLPCVDWAGVSVKVRPFILFDAVA
jgi:hypothetical protein